MEDTHETIRSAAGGKRLDTFSDWLFWDETLRKCIVADVTLCFQRPSMSALSSSDAPKSDAKLRASSLSTDLQCSCKTPAEETLLKRLLFTRVMIL